MARLGSTGRATTANAQFASERQSFLRSRLILFPGRSPRVSSRGRGAPRHVAPPPAAVRDGSGLDGPALRRFVAADQSITHIDPCLLGGHGASL